MDHKECRSPGQCSYCNGTVKHCVVCNCIDASLPTECPGHTVLIQRQELIYNGELDFQNGKWIDLRRNKTTAF